MTEATREAVVRDMIEAIDRHDLASLAAHPGLHETVQHIPHLWTAFPDLRHTVEEQFVAGDVVATRATIRGTHSGPFRGHAPTGKTVAFMLLMQDEVRDGRIVRHYALPDWMTLFAQLDLLPDVVTTTAGR